MRFFYNTFNISDVETILNAPETQDEGVWKYEHLRQFCMELNGLAVKLQVGSSWVSDSLISLRQPRYPQTVSLLSDSLFTHRQPRYPQLTKKNPRKIVAQLRTRLLTFMVFLSVVDPDPHGFGCPGIGSLLGMRIRIQEHGK
jgi:hypothetical protein